MKEEGKWRDPENFCVVFRCTTVQYAESFLDKGQIKFNTPASWVKYAFEKGEGRGDKLEGTIATCHMGDIERLKEINTKYKCYSDLLRVPIGNRVYFKRERDMLLPCFCFYILKNSMFECPGEEGEHKLTTMVPGAYFRDFMDNLDISQVNKLEKKDQPAVIIIHNYKKFEQKIIETLMSIGVKREEIIITRITYFDYNKYGADGWWDSGQKSPMQLAIKDKRFEEQSEARIIINTDNAKIKRILEKPIEIGPLHDVATLSKTYLHEGMLIEYTAKVELYE